MSFKQVQQLHTTADITAGRDLSVTGKATISSTLAVTQGTTLSSTLSVSGDASFVSDVSVTGGATISSTLAVTKGTTLGSTLSVGSDASFDSTLSVAGDATFSSDVIVNGNLNVVGNTVTTSSSEVNIGDAYLHLAAENVSTTATRAGIIVSCKASSEDTIFTYSSETMTISMDTNNSNKLKIVNSDMAGMLAAGDFLQISGAPKLTCNGLFEVDSVDTNTNIVLLKDSPTHTFTVSSSGSNFGTDNSDWTGSKLTKVFIGVASFNDGAWEVAQGDNADDIEFHRLSLSSYERVSLDSDKNVTTINTTFGGTGATSRTVSLPDASGDAKGRVYTIHNGTVNSFYVNSLGSNQTVAGETNYQVEADTVARFLAVDYGSNVYKWVCV